MLLTLLVLACRPPVPQISDTAAPDSGVIDSATTDTATDTAVDTSIDTGVDSGTDTGADSGTDTGTDSGTDTGTDSGTDTGTDSGTDTGTDTGVPPLTEAWFSFSRLEFVSATTDIADIYPTGARRFASIDGNFDDINPVLDELYRLSDDFAVEQVSGAELADLASSTRTGVTGVLGMTRAHGAFTSSGAGDGIGRGSDCALVVPDSAFDVDGVLLDVYAVDFNYGLFALELPGRAGGSLNLTNLVSLPLTPNTSLFFGRLTERSGSYRQRGALRVDLDAEGWRALLRGLNSDPSLASGFRDLAAVTLASSVAAAPDVDSDGDGVNDAFSALMVFELEPCAITRAPS